MRFSVLCLALIVAAVSPDPGRAADLPAMTVWKTPWCGCCGSWVSHMRANSFSVAVREVEDLDAIKRIAGVPEPLRSCHTAHAGGYVFEGHVPAADVKRLLSRRPDAHGLAVPGMPSGSPGMESDVHDPYDVLLIGNDGRVERFSSYQ